MLTNSVTSSLPELDPETLAEIQRHTPRSLKGRQAVVHGSEVKAAKNRKRRVNTGQGLRFVAPVSAEEMQEIITSANIWAERFRALLRQVKRRDRPLADAFEAGVTNVMTMASILLEAGRPDLAKVCLVDGLRRLDLRDLRKAPRRRDRPADATLLVWYEQVYRVLKAELPKRFRNPADRKLRLQEILKRPEFRDVVPQPISDQALKDWCALNSEEIALRVVSYPYRSSITPETLRKILSTARKGVRVFRLAGEIIEQPGQKVVVEYKAEYKP